MNRFPKPLIALLAGSFALGALGCATAPSERCYLSMDRYRELKDVFVATGSFQRVEQIMDDRQWADCERNQFRYLLEKDLFIDDLIVPQIDPPSRYQPPPDGPPQN